MNELLYSTVYVLALVLVPRYCMIRLEADWGTEGWRYTTCFLTGTSHELCRQDLPVPVPVDTRCLAQTCTRGFKSSWRDRG